MFRLENNVPDVYVNSSRDFQLFCRLYDSVFGGVKFSIDSVQRTSNTKECSAELLELLKTKVGLFTDIEISDDDLRYVLQAFPTILRYKGSLRGINYILMLFQRMSNNSRSFPIIDREELRNNHILKIALPEELENDKLLLELLKYVLPTGYMLEYYVSKTKSQKTTLYSVDKLELETVNVKENSQLRNSDDKGELHTTMGLTLISGKDDAEE